MRVYHRNGAIRYMGMIPVGFFWLIIHAATYARSKDEV